MIFDFLIIVFLISAGVVGFRQGLFVQLFVLLSWIVALWLAYEWTDDLSPLIRDWLFKEDGWISLVSMDQWIASLVAFLVIFFVVRLLLAFVRPLFGVVTKLPVFLQLNQFGGLFVSMIKALILLIVLVNILHLLSWETGQQIIEKSFFAQKILAITPSLTQELKELLIGSSS